MCIEFRKLIGWVLLSPTILFVLYSMWWALANFVGMLGVLTFMGVVAWIWSIQVGIDLITRKGED